MDQNFNVKYLSLNELKRHKSPVAIIIGNFDGLHLGHQSLIKNFTLECKRRSLLPVLITFTPHPVIYFKEEGYKHLINSKQTNHAHISNLGIKNVLELDFCEQLQKLKPVTFIQDFLLEISSLKMIYLGHDFKLGNGKIPAKELLRTEIKISNDPTIEVLEEDAYKFDGRVLSSSLIREELLSTKLTSIKTVNSMLGRSYELSGIVINGRGIGQKRLFPTANLSPDKNQLIPRMGVYRTKIRFRNTLYEGVTNIGINPTIASENNLSIESFIFYFDEDIYQEKIDVQFIEKLRDEMKFSGLDSLKKQINIDIENAKIKFRNENKISLALIGKSIGHSKSKEIYERLLRRSISYDLIDCDRPENIPSLVELMNKYIGVSITSPYKKHFLETTLVEPKGLIGVNCLNLLGNDIQSGLIVKSTNTDFLAVADILDHYNSKGVTHIFILGDGVMSKVTELALEASQINFEASVLSRKNGKLKNLKAMINQATSNTLVINSCSREYKFPKNINGQFHFWDMNYNLEHHSQQFKDTEIIYEDGIELLELQAKYALRFWNLKTV